MPDNEESLVLPYMYTRNPRIPILGQTLPIGDESFSIESLKNSRREALNIARDGLPPTFEHEGPIKLHRQLLGALCTDDDQINPLAIYVPLGFIAGGSRSTLPTVMLTQEDLATLPVLMFNPATYRGYLFQNYREPGYYAMFAGLILSTFYGLRPIRYGYEGQNNDIIRIVVESALKENSNEVGS